MKLNDSELIRILPASIASDKTVQNIAKSLSVNLNGVTEKIRNALIYSRIDEAGDALLDSLAWQFHVDIYDTAYTLEQKRLLVKEAVKDHFYKGTPYAVKTALSIISDAELEEWFDYGAAPYHFRVHLKRMPKNADEYNKVDSICKTTKNVRSWCDGVQCDIGVNWKIRIGGVKQIRRAITVFPKGTDEEPMGATWYTGIATRYVDDVDLYSEKRKTVTNTGHVGGVVRIRKKSEIGK